VNGYDERRTLSSCSFRSCCPRWIIAWQLLHTIARWDSLVVREPFELGHLGLHFATVAGWNCAWSAEREQAEELEQAEGRPGPGDGEPGSSLTEASSGAGRPESR
jgi:hypothetical protein